MTELEPSQYYTGIVAELYRHLRSSTFDPAPYARFVRRFGTPALELGCGDGDPIIDLIAGGLEVDGLDSSADMLQRCRLAADVRGLTVRLYEQSIETMQLPDAYRSIYLAGATFNLLPDDETAASALDRIGEHLQPGGAALIPLFVPEPVSAGQIGSVREHRSDDGSSMRLTTMSADRDEAARNQHTVLRYEVLVDAAVTDSDDRTWLIHWHTRQGFADLARSAGLNVAHVFDGEGDDSGAFTFLLTRPE